MRHMMVDAETLATTGLPIFLQLGAAIFDDETNDFVLNAAFEVNVSVDSCVALGAIPDDGAFRFWLTQPEEARRSVAVKGGPIARALDLLDHFWYTHQPERVWLQGENFDIPHLERYYERLNRRPPWGYNQARDTRTVYELAEFLTDWVRPEQVTAHTALADARAQVGTLLSARHALSEAAQLGTVLMRARAAALAKEAEVEKTEEPDYRDPGTGVRAAAEGNASIGVTDYPGVAISAGETIVVTSAAAVTLYEEGGEGGWTASPQ